MKLVYNILWVDNEDGIYNDHKDKVIEHLEEWGFEPSIKFLNDFEHYEREKLNLENFDLFVLDYKLKHGDNGNKIVQDIREEHSIYTEILFYSAVPEEARKQIFEDNLNGVYVTSRDFEDFEDDILGLIDVTIKKVQDVNNLRGLIMAEVAELDWIQEQIIIKASEKIENKAIEKYTLRKVKESANSNKNKSQRLLDDILNVTFEKLFENTGFIDSDKKTKATGEILKKLSIEEPVSKDSFIQLYIENILYIRNKFAHIKECDGKDENGVNCKLIGDIPFTQDKCIEIRKKIKEYKKLLEEIEKKI
jgi:hypothetical protein